MFALSSVPGAPAQLPPGDLGANLSRVFESLANLLQAQPGAASTGLQPSLVEPTEKSPAQPRAAGDLDPAQPKRKRGRPRKHPLSPTSTG
jgi:hypothetical protein